jgi:hypothetical protein
MENWFVIYLLSIADNMKDNLHTTGTWCVSFALAAYGVCKIRHWLMLEDSTRERVERLTAEHIQFEPKVRKFALIIGPIGMMLWLSSTLFPSVENVLKAYALIEGSKVINAPNAQLAAEAVGKRFDKFLDIVDKGINGRSKQETKQEVVKEGVAPTPGSP